MGFYLQHKNFYNLPIRLEKEQQAKPYEVIKSFCGAYNLHEIRQHLWDLLEISVTTENYVFDEASARNNIFLFYRQLEELIEAIYIINAKKLNKEPGNKNE